MKLSVIIPVYNEKETIEEIIRKVQEQDLEKEIILVDDYSSDGTRAILKDKFEGKDNIRVIYQDRNRGKGTCIRTGLKCAAGDAVIIQDADLEYEPSEYNRLIERMRTTGADVVYGSRFLSKEKVTPTWHYLVNKFLTFLTNLLYGSRLTDMETCYKLMKKSAIDSLDLKSKRFEIEAELTSKFLKNKTKIEEVPISYRGRWYHQGKKITWLDGLVTVFVLLKYRFRK